MCMYVHRAQEVRKVLKEIALNFIHDVDFKVYSLFFFHGICYCHGAAL